MAKVELKTALPTDPQERKRLAKVMDELIEIEQSIKDLKEAKKSIIQVEKEDHEYSPKMINKYLKLEYSRRKDAEKVQADLEDSLEKDAELKILFGIKD